MKLYGKEKTIEKLTAFRRTGRFPHGLLLCGEQGTGKSVVADYIAMLYLCEKQRETPCFSCTECKRVEQHIHPDVVYVDCKGFKAEEMRRTVQEGYKLPNDGEVRIFVLKNFDLCAEVCQNILLKFIEEPLSFNRFVLTAGSVSGILPTILSRVVKTDVPLPAVEQCCEALSAQGVPLDKAKSLSQSFNGNIGKCLAAYGGENGKETSPELAAMEAAGEIIGDIIAGNEYKTAVKIQTLSSREELSAVLSLLLEMFRDAMALRSGSRVPVSFDKNAGVKLSQKYSLKRLYDGAEIIGKYICTAQLNCNLSIASNAFTAELFGVLK